MSFSNVLPMTDSLNGSFRFDASGIVGQSHSHEISGEGLCQMLAVWGAEPQSLPGVHGEVGDEYFRQRKQTVKVHHRPRQQGAGLTLGYRPGEVIRRWSVRTSPGHSSASPRHNLTHSVDDKPRSRRPGWTTDSLA